LRIKEILKFTKTSILDPKDEHDKFIINEKNGESVRVIITYISREIFFHTSGINYPNQVWKKLKTLFNKNDES